MSIDRTTYTVTGNPDYRASSNDEVPILSATDKAANTVAEATLKAVSERRSKQQIPRTPSGSALKAIRALSSPARSNPQRPSSQASGGSSAEAVPENTPMPNSRSGSIAQDQPSAVTPEDRQSGTPHRDESHTGTPQILQFRDLKINTSPATKLASNEGTPTSALARPQPTAALAQSIVNEFKEPSHSAIAAPPITFTFNPESPFSHVDSRDIADSKTNSLARGALGLTTEENATPQDQNSSSSSGSKLKPQNSSCSQEGISQDYFQDSDNESYTASSNGDNEHCAASSKYSTLDDDLLMSGSNESLSNHSQKKFLSKDIVTTNFPRIKAKIEETIRKHLKDYYANSAKEVLDIKSYIKSIPEFQNAKEIEFVSTDKGIFGAVFVVIDGEKKFVLKGVGIPPQFLNLFSEDKNLRREFNQGGREERYRIQERLSKCLLKFKYPNRITVNDIEFEVDSSEWGEEKSYNELVSAVITDLEKQKEQNPSLQNLLQTTDLKEKITKAIKQAQENVEIVEEEESDFTDNINKFLVEDFEMVLEKQMEPYYAAANNEKIAAIVGKALGVKVPETELIKTDDGKVYSLHTFAENQGTILNPSSEYSSEEIDLKSVQLMFVLDGLLQNVDRNPDNILLSAEGNDIILIDHALSLQSSKRNNTAFYIAQRSGSISAFKSELKIPFSEEIKRIISDLNGQDLIKEISSKNLQMTENIDLFLRSRIIRAKKMVRNIPDLTPSQFLWGVCSEEKYIELLHDSNRKLLLAKKLQGSFRSRQRKTTE
jgi:hypothetical protein